MISPHCISAQYSPLTLSSPLPILLLSPLYKQLHFNIHYLRAEIIQCGRRSPRGSDRWLIGELAPGNWRLLSGSLALGIPTIWAGFKRKH